MKRYIRITASADQDYEPLTKDGFCIYFQPYLDPEVADKASDILYKWYMNEGEEFMPSRSDILDMCDAADNLDDVKLVLEAMGEDNWSEEDVEGASTIADNGYEVFQLMEYISDPETGIDGDEFYCYGEFFAVDKADAENQLEEAKKLYPQFFQISSSPYSDIYINEYNEYFATGNEIYENVSAIIQNIDIPEEVDDIEVPFN